MNNFYVGRDQSWKLLLAQKNPTKLSAAIDIVVAHESNCTIRDNAKIISPSLISNKANVKISITEKIENPPQNAHDKNIVSLQMNRTQTTRMPHLTSKDYGWKL